MKIILLLTAAICSSPLLLEAGTQRDAEREILHLFEYLKTSGCEFNRNGRWYGPDEAAEHLERKYRYLMGRGMIHSAEQFIERAASQSSMSGRPYQVKCGDGEPVYSNKWFNHELRKFRDESDYIAAFSISKNGFARNSKEMHKLNGREVKVWGFVDHANMFGDESARRILKDWWGGYGPDAATWSFNLKAEAEDAPGRSFPVRAPNDKGRDGLLETFLADASANRPTKVFVKGRIFTFDAPANITTYTGLYMELWSSQDILLDRPGEQ